MGPLPAGFINEVKAVIGFSGDVQKCSAYFKTKYLYSSLNFTIYHSLLKVCIYNYMLILFVVMIILFCINPCYTSTFMCFNISPLGKTVLQCGSVP